MSDPSDSEALRRKWDARHREAGGLPTPTEVLRANTHLLPARGRALDLACGRGADALLLARQGLSVTAWDLSPVAIERLRAEALGRGVEIAAEVRDVEARPPEPECFDVILVAHFLSRRLAPAIAAALTPGGLLLYQTWVRDAPGQRGPSSPTFRLATNELLELFSGLRVRLYREEGWCGDARRGLRDQAQFIGERPSVDDGRCGGSGEMG